ncbi:MAG: annexin, partial [Candidatus Limnocylindrales bacterium]
MRTHVDGHTPARPAAPGAAEPGRRRPGDATPAVTGALTPGLVAQLQAMAGNRAAVQALRSGRVVQRAISTGQAAGLAERLHDAMEGLGTDEDAVYGALTSRTPEDLDAIREAYFFAYNHSLLEDINDEFSGDELARVMQLLEGRPAPGATATPEEAAAAGISQAGEIAQQLVDAMSGAGTEEDQIFNALEGRSAEEMDEIRRQYFALSGHSLDRDLRDEMSGEDLARALALVNSTGSGSFENAFSEYLTEDYQGGGRGIWEWEIASGRFLVHVGVRFAPDAGITAPIALWQTQIRDIWNRFALTGNGGTTGGGFEYPIEFDLQDQSGADRSVRVIANANGTNYAYPDRAYSNLWYQDMPEMVAPHEFGHLVGLPDEYERTQEDYQSAGVTGETITGPTNESGRTDRQIADDLHGALFLEDVAQRSPRATTVCDSVGLISGGAAQQGLFAQRVMRAYNEAYEATDSESLLHAIRYRVEPGTWVTLIGVFSFTSDTVMGNESDHTHPVEPRHLRFALDVIREHHPDVTWGLRPLR